MKKKEINGSSLAIFIVILLIIATLTAIQVMKYEMCHVMVPEVSDEYKDMKPFNPGISVYDLPVPCTNMTRDAGGCSDWTTYLGNKEREKENK